jgi:hypothetical protein
LVGFYVLNQGLNLRECKQSIGAIEIPENSVNQPITYEGLTAQQSLAWFDVATNPDGNLTWQLS